MKKILLTSSGFETQRIMDVFLGLFAVKAECIKSLFIPTAAIHPDAIEVLPKCLNDLLCAGICRENITVFDLHRGMTDDEIQKFDVIYFAGGSSEYLLQRINDTGLNESLVRFIDNGGVYVGVSAGSIVAANNTPKNLGYIDCTLHVHAQTGTECGIINFLENLHIHLTGKNAILISDNKAEVFE
jgi:Peptidase E